MKISLAIIIKDNSEVEKLNNCLDTIQQYVDGTYITATGEEVDKIEKLCKDRKCHYSYFKWNKDFSDARNFNFSQVPKDTDYILWLDSDDLFVGGELLRKIAGESLERGKDIVFFTYWYGCTFNGKPSLETMVSVDIEQPRERLIRYGTHEWKGKLHETPVPKSGQKNNYTSYFYDPKERPIAVLHTASLEDAEQKMSRNKEIVELQLEEETKDNKRDPRTILSLMKIYTELDDSKLWEETLKLGKEYLEKSGWDEERAVCYEQMGAVTQKMNKLSLAVECFSGAIREYPHNPLFYLRLALTYYNLGQYRNAERWLEASLHIDLQNIGSTAINIKAMKVAVAELSLKLAFNVQKNPKLSVKAAEMLFNENPTENNKQNLLYLMDIDDMNDACEHLSKFCKWLEDTNQKKYIPNLLNDLPTSVTSQPFAIKLLKRNQKPRKWKDNEICYFANFGQNHFFKWDGNSINEGIGGSETAVIRLSEEWVKKGYRVIVYGDPKEPCTINGVEYLPWYHFNAKDKFNIVIQWRANGLSNKIKCKKLYIDLHDIFSGIDYDEKRMKGITKVMVKSEYHRELAPNIKDCQIKVISNGINYE